MHEVGRVVTWLLGLRVGIPELFGLVLREVLVVVIGGASLHKWRVAGEHREDDNTRGEKINLGSLIGRFGQKLGSHVGGSSKICCKPATSLRAMDRASKSKVINFEVIVVIHETVLNLDISVSYSCIVAKIKSFQELLSIESS